MTIAEFCNWKKGEMIKLVNKKSLKRKRPMSSEEEEEEITLMEFYKRMKRRRVLSADEIPSRMVREMFVLPPSSMKKKEKSEEEKKNTLPPAKEDEENTDEIASRKLQKRKRMLRERFVRKRRPISIRSPLHMKKKKKEKSEEKKNTLPPTKEEDEEKKQENKEKKNTLPPTKEEDEEKKPPIPVYEESLDGLKLYPDDVVESEEETLGDRERPVEFDFGCKFVINQDELTYTRLRHPLKLYYKSHELRSGSVLHNLKYPVSTVSKKALDRYNAIEGTNYEYVGLVKAYRTPVAGSQYTVRFKARLPDQDPIYFQAMVWQQLPDKIKKVVVLDVSFVHPLP